MKFIQKDLFLYYVFASPATLVGIFFSVSLLTNRSSVIYSFEVPLIGVAVATALEFFILGLISFSLIRRKVSILSILPILSFFLYMAGYGMQVRVPPLTVALTMSVVLISTFCALASFKYSRASMLSKQGKVILRRDGPAGYAILNHMLDYVFPVTLVVLLAVTVAWLMGIIRQGLTKIPGPLSSLGAEYISTNIGQATFGVIILGAVLWISKQFVEPILLNYSLSKSQALDLLLSEDDMYQKMRSKKELKLVSLRGWVLLSLFTLALAIGVTVYLGGLEYTVSSLRSIFAGSSTTTNFDKLIHDDFNSIGDSITRFVIQGENLIRILFRILFG